MRTCRSCSRPVDEAKSGICPECGTRFETRDRETDDRLSPPDRGALVWWTPSWTALVSIAAFGALHLVRRSFSSFPSRELFTATLATVVVIWLAFAVLTFLRRGPVNRLVGLALLATALSPAGLATFDYLQALILESLDVQTTGRPFARLKLWLWGPAP